jgi:DNA polymerase-3 subunit epsilon
LHGALLDAEILADVYLTMTSGQSGLFRNEGLNEAKNIRAKHRKLDLNRTPIPVQSATQDELREHRERLDDINKRSGDGCLWLQLEGEN